MKYIIIIAITIVITLLAVKYVDFNEYFDNVKQEQYQEPTSDPFTDLSWM